MCTVSAGQRRSAPVGTGTAPVGIAGCRGDRNNAALRPEVLQDHAAAVGVKQEELRSVFGCCAHPTQRAAGTGLAHMRAAVQPAQPAAGQHEYWRTRVGSGRPGAAFCGPSLQAHGAPCSRNSLKASASRRMRSVVSLYSGPRHLMKLPACLTNTERPRPTSSTRCEKLRLPPEISVTRRSLAPEAWESPSHGKWSKASRHPSQTTPVPLRATYRHPVARERGGSQQQI